MSKIQYTKIHHEKNKVFLNFPKKLNVLDEIMVKELLPLLKSEDIESKSEVFLLGVGDKGFCAGGDVVSVVEGIKEGREFDFFFKQEYELDLFLHRKNNIYGLGHGIVMGGGLGLLMGCEKRFLREDCVIAMPEVTIGFFPDVAANYFLKSIPREWRLFMGLTGARLSAWDFLSLGLCHGVISNKDWATLTAAPDLKTCEGLTLNIPEDKKIEFETKSKLIKSLATMPSLSGYEEWCIKDHLKSEWVINDSIWEWFQTSLRTSRTGCPLSKVITWHLFANEGVETIEEAFELDLKMARHCTDSGEFTEGVRALLIDKDKSPKWKYDSISLAENYFKG